MKYMTEMLGAPPVVETKTGITEVERNIAIWRLISRQELTPQDGTNWDNEKQRGRIISGWGKLQAGQAMARKEMDAMGGRANVERMGRLWDFDQEYRAAIARNPQMANEENRAILEKHDISEEDLHILAGVAPVETKNQGVAEEPEVIGDGENPGVGVTKETAETEEGKGEDLSEEEVVILANAGDQQSDQLARSELLEEEEVVTSDQEAEGRKRRYDVLADRFLEDNNSLSEGELWELYDLDEEFNAERHEEEVRRAEEEERAAAEAAAVKAGESEGGKPSGGAEAAEGNQRVEVVEETAEEESRRKQQEQDEELLSVKKEMNRREREESFAGRFGNFMQRVKERARGGRERLAAAGERMKMKLANIKERVVEKIESSRAAGGEGRRKRIEYEIRWLNDMVVRIGDKSKTENLRDEDRGWWAEYYQSRADRLNRRLQRMEGRRQEAEHNARVKLSLEERLRGWVDRSKLQPVRV